MEAFKERDPCWDLLFSVEEAVDESIYLDGHRSGDAQNLRNDLLVAPGIVLILWSVHDNERLELFFAEWKPNHLRQDSWEIFHLVVRRAAHDYNVIRE